MRYNNSMLEGMTHDQLKTALVVAQQARLDLLSGNKGVSFSYTQGDGTRSVSYQQTSIDQLMALILELQAKLGMIARPRSPIRVRY